MRYLSTRVSNVDNTLHLKASSHAAFAVPSRSSNTCDLIFFVNNKNVNSEMLMWRGCVKISCQESTLRKEIPENLSVYKIYSRK